MRFHLLDPPAAEEPPRLNCVKRKTQRKPYADNQDTHPPRSARDGFDTTSVFREVGSPKGLSVDRHKPRASEDQNQLFNVAFNSSLKQAVLAMKGGEEFTNSGNLHSFAFP